MVDITTPITPNYDNLKYENEITLIEEYTNVHILENIANIDIHDKSYDKNIHIPNEHISFANKIYDNIHRPKNNALVKYKAKNNIGRLYPQTQSYQQMPSFMRRLIINDSFYDIDIVNSQMSILINICKQCNIDCKYIQEYSENRNSYNDKITTAFTNATPQDIKQLIITTMFGGRIENWIEQNNISINPNNYNDIIHIIHNIKTNINNIIFSLEDKNITLYNQCKNISEKNSNNIRYSTFSLFLQEIEKRIIYNIISFFNDKHYNVCSLIHDGIFIKKDNNNIIDNNVLLECQNHIYNISGYEIKLTIKPTIATNDDIEYYNKHKNLFFTEFICIKNLCKYPTPLSIAKQFNKMYGSNYIYTDNKLYHYNGTYWKLDNNKTTLTINIQNDFIQSVLAHLHHYNNIENIHPNSNINEHKLTLASIKKCIDTIKNIEDPLYCDKIIKSIITIITNDDVRFDTNWNYFAFNDKIYDLITHSFITPYKEQYISLTTGYNYNDYCDDDNTELTTFLNEILPIQNERDTYMMILSTCLEGRQYEKFIVANGNGGNGKTSLHELIAETLGNYFYNAKNDLLQEKPPTAASPGFANMNKKRLVLITEPNPKKKLLSNIIKQVTGDKIINARQLYSNNTYVNLHCTFIIECNAKCNIDEIDEAIQRRLIDIPFRSSYKDASLYDAHKHLPHVYKANIYYKSNNFLRKNKIHLFNMLVDYHKKYADNNFDIKLPASIYERTSQYLEDSDELFNWFSENYEFVDDNTVYISIASIYENFKNQDVYHNLTKNEKRTYTLKRFKSLCMTNLFIKKYFVERYQKNNDNININTTNIITNYRIKNNMKL